jgi:hypothetical protein
MAELQKEVVCRTLAPYVQLGGPASLIHPPTGLCPPDICRRLLSVGDFETVRVIERNDGKPPLVVHEACLKYFMERVDTECVKRMSPSWTSVYEDYELPTTLTRNAFTNRVMQTWNEFNVGVAFLAAARESKSEVVPQYIHWIGHPGQKLPGLPVSLFFCMQAVAEFQSPNDLPPLSSVEPPTFQGARVLEAQRLLCQETEADGSLTRFAVVVLTPLATRAAVQALARLQELADACSLADLSEHNWHHDEASRFHNRALAYVAELTGAPQHAVVTCAVQRTSGGWSKRDNLFLRCAPMRQRGLVVDAQRNVWRVQPRGDNWLVPVLPSDEEFATSRLKDLLVVGSPVGGPS